MPVAQIVILRIKPKRYRRFDLENGPSLGEITGGTGGNFANADVLVTPNSMCSTLLEVRQVDSLPPAKEPQVGGRNSYFSIR